jgi:hypothetical protein
MLFTAMILLALLSTPERNQPLMAATQSRLATGSWGGEHVGLDVTAQGGTLEFDCAHGSFKGRPKLDAQGKFVVIGTYEAEHGGPVRADETPNPLKVEYVGVVKNGKLRLSVRRVGAKRAIVAFNLVHGQEAMLFKCR